MYSYSQNANEVKINSSFVPDNIPNKALMKKQKKKLSGTTKNAPNNLTFDHINATLLLQRSCSSRSLQTVNWAFPWVWYYHHHNHLLSFLVSSEQRSTQFKRVRTRSTTNTSQDSTRTSKRVCLKRNWFHRKSVRNTPLHHNIILIVMWCTDEYPLATKEKITQRGMYFPCSVLVSETDWPDFSSDLIVWCRQPSDLGLLSRFPLLKIARSVGQQKAPITF